MNITTTDRARMAAGLRSATGPESARCRNRRRHEYPQQNPGDRFGVDHKQENGGDRRQRVTQASRFVM